jgi:DNA-binding response OmpR family regulator
MSSTPSDARSDVKRQDAANYRILVVDDDPGLMRLVSAILRSAGYAVVTAADGSDALVVAQTESFDAIVLDLLMPVLDGRGFFRELRALGRTTPVLIASAYGARDAQIELGAEGSIRKPFEPDALLDAVARVLGRAT